MSSVSRPSTFYFIFAIKVLSTALLIILVLPLLFKPFLAPMNDQGKSGQGYSRKYVTFPNLVSILVGSLPRSFSTYAVELS